MCDGCCDLVCADLAELAISEWLREDAVVDEAESIPFGGTLGFEVPEYPMLLLVVARIEWDPKWFHQLTIHWYYAQKSQAAPQ